MPIGSTPMSSTNVQSSTLSCENVSFIQIGQPHKLEILPLFSNNQNFPPLVLIQAAYIQQALINAQQQKSQSSIKIDNSATNGKRETLTLDQFAQQSTSSSFTTATNQLQLQALAQQHNQQHQHQKNQQNQQNQQSPQNQQNRQYQQNQAKMSDNENMLAILKNSFQNNTSQMIKLENGQYVNLADFGPRAALEQALQQQQQLKQKNNNKIRNHEYQVLIQNQLQNHEGLQASSENMRSSENRIVNENRILGENIIPGENRILTENRLQNHAELTTTQNLQKISSQSDTQHLKSLIQCSSNNNARNNVLNNLQNIQITQNTMNSQNTQMHDNNMQNTQNTQNTQNAQNTQSHAQMPNSTEIIQNSNTGSQNCNLPKHDVIHGNLPPPTPQTRPPPPRMLTQEQINQQQIHEALRAQQLSAIIKHQQNSSSGASSTSPPPPVKIEHYQNNFSSALLKQFDVYRKESTLIDCVIEVKGGKLFNCHKIIMSSSSLTLSNMLSEMDKEQGKGKIAEIKLDFVSAETFNFIIEFLYTARVGLEESTAEDILKASMELQCSDLINACVYFLKRRIHRNTWCSLLNFASEHPEKLSSLYSAAKTYCIDHFYQLAASNGESNKRNNLNDLKKEQLLDILKADKLNVPTERIVFKVAKDWVEARKLKLEMTGTSKLKVIDENNSLKQNSIHSEKFEKPGNHKFDKNNKSDKNFKKTDKISLKNCKNSRKLVDNSEELLKLKAADQVSKDFVDIVSAVRLPLLDPQFLLDVVQKDPMMRNNNAAESLLDEARRFQMLPDQRALLSSPRTKPRVAYRPKRFETVLAVVGGMDEHRQPQTQCSFFQLPPLQLNSQIKTVSDSGVLQNSQNSPILHRNSQSFQNSPNLPNSPNKNSEKSSPKYIPVTNLETAGGAMERDQPNVDPRKPQALLGGNTSTIAKIPRNRASGYTVTALNDNLIICGGLENRECVADCWMYIPSLNEWHQIAPLNQGRYSAFKN